MEVSSPPLKLKAKRINGSPFLNLFFSSSGSKGTSSKKIE